jgi:hypothetical protein
LSYLRFLLFVGGIILAIGASAKMSPMTVQRLQDPDAIVVDEPPSQWPDTFPAFVIGMGMAAAGVVLWRMEMRREREQQSAGAEQHPGDLDRAMATTDPLRSALEGIEPIEQIIREADRLRAWELMRRVDEVLETHVLPTVERRQEVMSRYGMSAGAEILIALAYGERMLNRVWSAAADGHLPEAHSCLPEALEGFREVRRQSQNAVTRSESGRT